MSRVVLSFYWFALALHRVGVPFLPWLLNKLLVRILFSCQIGLGAQIGRGTDLGYGGLGVVIHPRAVIGRNCSIGTGVTIGGNFGKVGVPVLGDNCRVATGARILGPVTIGEGAIIGANAVVLGDVPPHTVYVGVPARFLRHVGPSGNVGEES